MNNGWIKLHRKFRKWEWYGVPNMVSIFVHFLLLANHEEGKWQGRTIKPGQFITGRKMLKRDTGLTEQNIRTCIERLKSTNEITIETTNKFSLITIVKWADYQGNDNKVTSKTTMKLTNNQPTTNHKQELKELKNNTSGSSQNPRMFANNLPITGNELAQTDADYEVVACDEDGNPLAKKGPNLSKIYNQMLDHMAAQRNKITNENFSFKGLKTRHYKCLKILREQFKLSPQDVYDGWDKLCYEYNDSKFLQSKGFDLYDLITRLTKKG